MERSQVVQVLREKAAGMLEVDLEQVVESTTFGADLQADSLWLVELAVELEEALGVDLIEQDLTGVETVGDFADLVVARLP